MRANVEKLIRLQNQDLIDKNELVFPPPDRTSTSSAHRSRVG